MQLLRSVGIPYLPCVYGRRYIAEQSLAWNSMVNGEKTPLLRSASQSEKSKSLPLGVGFKPPSNEKGDDDAINLVPIGKLFRFCDRTDVFLIILAVFGSFVYGFLNPGQFILFGSLMDDFVDYTRCIKNINCTDPIDLEDRMKTIAIWYVGIAFANFFFAWMSMGLFALSAERQVYKMRLALFRSAIYQNIGWFDMYTAGGINTRLTEDTNKVADGIGSKFGRMLSCVVSFFAGYAIGFTRVWQLTLVLLATFPLIVMVGGLMAKVTGDQTAKELEAYSKAGFVAEQSISSIRTVAAFGGEERQGKLYDSHLGDACKFGTRKGLGMGVGMGAFQFVVYSSYCLAIWYLVKLVKDGDAESGDGMTTFFASTIGSLMLGQAGPSAEALSAARGAAGTIFKIIDRKSEIDASSKTGLKPAVVKGDVEFSRIDFVYPTRPSVPILDDFSLKIAHGTRVALVGESGCGKSTIVKLVQRFYDPVKGKVFVDGQDITSLNVRHLRNFIGVVNQEPVLFATTISENIAYGREGVTQREIEEAAKMANAHDFITQFPQGYDTFCGERGAKMSGGQKQRIAIARALVRNPKILLLDEATSALDTESEAVVQEALDKAGEGRTTIIIAHRLSTVRNADAIVAMSKGRIGEIGTHDELMAKDGLYHSLVKLQEGDEEDDEEESDEHVADKNLAVLSMPSTVATSRILGTSQVYEATKADIHHLERVNEILKVDDDDYDGVFKVPFLTILKQNAPEWKYLLVGCIGAGLFGAYPFLYAISFGGISDTLSNDPNVPEQRDDMEDDGLKWSLFLLIIGVESGIGIFLQNYYLAKAGELLTMRLRKETFLAFLRQNIAYYDKPNHGTGAICTRLSSEVSSIQGATGSQLGLLVAAVVTVIGGVIVAFTSCWQLTLVMLAFVPLLCVAGLFMNTFLGGGGGSSDTSSTAAEAGQASEEALANIQTVVSLGREDEFFERYRLALAKSLKKAKRKSHFAGLASGCVLGIVNLSFAAGFYYGGHLVVEGDVTLQDMMRSIFTVIMCAVILGQVASLTPDYSKAKSAANRVFYLLQKIPPIDSYSDAGRSPETCNGEIYISNVRFRYPTRRNFKVLCNFSLTVKPGQTVALVGTSGCGKSTSVSLVERFYDVNTGSVSIDGQNVKGLNLKWLRSQIGIVSQEPILFDLSIKENIAYGDTTRHVTDKEIEEAARAANIHEFISSLPEGYNTMVGDKGTLISGGQKQRIAIARALVRDPKILLLDEATSALDTESEKVVQHALDKASIGRTTLVIAHRLSTIQHADQIVVIKKGRVVESGNHHELMALKGIYHALHKAQSLAHK